MAVPITPLYQEIPYQDVNNLFISLADKKWAICLDSANYTQPFQNTNRYSYIVLSPFQTVLLKNGILEDNQNPTADPFDLLKKCLLRFKVNKIKGLPPFQGGIAGYFAYDLCHYIEKIPYACIDDMNFPDLAVGYYDTVISFDHSMRQAWIISTGFPEVEESRDENGRIHVWQNCWQL